MSLTCSTDYFEIIRAVGPGWMAFTGPTMSPKAAEKHLKRLKNLGKLPSLRDPHCAVSVIKEGRLFPRYSYTVTPLTY